MSSTCDFETASVRATLSSRSVISRITNSFLFTVILTQENVKRSGVTSKSSQGISASNVSERELLNIERGLTLPRGATIHQTGISVRKGFAMRIRADAVDT